MPKILFIDCETTSANTTTAGIHQIAGSVWIEGAKLESFSFNVAPHHNAEINSTSIAISTRTYAQIAQFPSCTIVHDLFKTILSKYVDRYNKADKFFVCGYNVQAFDVPVVDKWFKDCGDPYFRAWIHNATLDLMILAGQRLMNERHLMPDFKLPTVARRMGIEVDESRLHDAAYDVELCEQMYAIMYAPQPSIHYQNA